MSEHQPETPAHIDLEAPGDALAAEVAKLKSACRTLAKIVTGQHRAMEAARIEMAQGSTHKAMQWILNSLPDVWDDEETKWDGRESADEWWERTEDFYRAAASEEKAPAAPPAPVAASLAIRCARCSTIAPELLMMRGEVLCPSCWDRAEAGGLDREALGRLVHDTRLACEAERAKAEGRELFRLGTWGSRSDAQQALDIRIAEAVAEAVLTSVLRSTEKAVLTENRSEGEAW